MNVTLSFTDPERAREFEGFCAALGVTPDELASALVNQYIYDAVWFHVTRLAKGLPCPTTKVIDQLRTPAGVFGSADAETSHPDHPPQEEVQ
ncbi:hypothetical protein [Deinococcus roseus]|uniref:Uncharacterized protein n=1 Tax=Deinococcus roseus TaxID=392414 RepID=A0ABQ2DHJ0_9DEIO|nr:hypothetical protein [Deinococcus roseus]GGJ56458.1 hypothetical protein GCM10008938_48270 [Deinococcus roseus]